MRVVALALALYAGFPLLELEYNTNKKQKQWAKLVIVA